MKTIFVISKNSKTPNLHESLLNLNVSKIEFLGGESATHGKT